MQCTTVASSNAASLSCRLCHVIQCELGTFLLLPWQSMGVHSHTSF